MILVLAAGLIAASLGADAFDRAPAPQRADTKGAALVYGPHQLARGTRVDATHVRYIVREFGVSARAVRFAVRPGTPPPTPADTGVQLLLDPADTSALAGRRVRAELDIHRFSITAAGAIALRLGDGPWVTTPLPATSGRLRVDLPAPAAAPTTLGLRMLTDRKDLNYGAEIRSLSLQPAS